MWGCDTSGTSEDGNTDPSSFSDDKGSVVWVLDRPGAANDVATFDDGAFVVVGKVGKYIDAQDAFIIRYDEARNEEWTLKTTGDGSAEAIAVAMLPDDSIAVTGLFQGEVTFEGTSGKETISTASEAFEDFFVARIDTDGELLWVIPGGCDYSATVTDVVATSDEDITVVGHFQGTTSFGGGAVVHASLQDGDELLQDVFIARYDMQGGFRWARFGQPVGHPSPIFAFPTINGAAALSDDGVAVVGTAHIILVLRDENQEIELYSYAASDLFLARYDADGNIEWATKTETEMVDDAGGDTISASDDDTLVVAGSHYGITAFRSDIVYDSGNRMLSFIASYTESGTLNWAQEIYTDDREYRHSIQKIQVVDGNRFLVSGFTAGNTIFGKGQDGETVLNKGLTPFIAGYDLNGTFSWVTHMEIENNLAVSSIAPYGEDAALVSGWFRGTVQLSPDSDVPHQLETPDDDPRMFTMKLNF